MICAAQRRLFSGFAMSTVRPEKIEPKEGVFQCCRRNGFRSSPIICGNLRP
jgi:hypothetical protein